MARLAGMTLADAAPREFMGAEYNDVRARRFAEIEVVESRSGSLCREHGVLVWRKDPWPGREKNVLVWWVLANGYAVGWNENPSRGWSFPVVRYSKKGPTP